jgi:hypothetical protein
MQIAGQECSAYRVLEIAAFIAQGAEDSGYFRNAKSIDFLLAF